MSTPENFPSADPRAASGFLPHFFPLSDFRDFPPGNPGAKNDRIRLQFLAMHYDINLAFGGFLTPECNRDPEEKAQLEQQWKSVRTLRDQMEYYYASVGIIAEPTVAKGFVVNLAFTFPNESRWFREQLDTGPRKAELKFCMPQADGSDGV